MTKKLYFKMYLKKTLFMGLWCLGLIVLFAVLYPVFGSVSNFFSPDNILRYTISMGIPAVIILIVIIRGRSKLLVVKEEYLSMLGNGEAKWKKSFLYLVKMPEFLMEIAAFATCATLFFLPVAISATASFIVKILSYILMIALFSLGYAMLDLLAWGVVFRKWNKER